VSDKNKAIELALSQIEKQFGKGAIMRLGNDEALPDVEAISTGSISLDLALGVGGVPRGRVIEIYGPESSGKTTLALHIVAEAQKTGGIAAFVDAEHALDVGYARKLGVKPMICWFPSRTPANRPWRSLKPLCAAAPLMCWWWTLWLPWCPRLRSKGRWAIPIWVCRPA